MCPCQIAGYTTHIDGCWKLEGENTDIEDKGGDGIVGDIYEPFKGSPAEDRKKARQLIGRNGRKK